ncbi:MAG: hypothetical protein U0237_14815 [Thermoleophilia bacterium]
MSADGLGFLDLTDAQREILEHLGVRDARSLLKVDELDLRAAMGRSAGRRRVVATKQQVEGWLEQARRHVASEPGGAATSVVAVSQEVTWESAVGFTLLFEWRDVEGVPNRQISVQRTEPGAADVTEPSSHEIEGWDAPALAEWIAQHLHVSVAPAPTAELVPAEEAGPQLRVVGVNVTGADGTRVPLIRRGEVATEEIRLSAAGPVEVAVTAPEGAEPPQVAIRTGHPGSRAWQTTDVATAADGIARLSLASLLPGRYQAKLVAFIPGLPCLVTLRLPPLTVV